MEAFRGKGLVGTLPITSKFHLYLKLLLANKICMKETRHVFPISTAFADPSVCPGALSCSHTMRLLPITHCPMLPR